MINITCNNKEVRTGTCADVGDSNVVAYISFFDTINNTERKLYQPVYGDFKTSTAYLFDLSGNSITLTYADSNKTRTELEDLLVDCCGCVGGDGTVTSFSAGNLSPLFTTNVATPTTTPALSFNLSNCNQYQVFGRVVAGTGAPSYVPLNPIAFNGLSLPNNEIAYGTGSGISSNGNLKYNGNSGLQIGGGTNTAYCAINIGNGVITNNSDFSFVLTENTANVISGLGNAVASFIIGSGNTITTGDITSSAYHNKIFGSNNSISAAPSKYAMYNFISGRDNIVTDGYYNNILGHNVTNNGYYGCLALTDSPYGGSITLTASNQFTARFSGGYRFMKDGSTQWMAIAPTTGYVTINNIPTAASATDILVSNGGVVSTRTVASLGIPVITPAALTKTDDTNVTISLGGTPATALLQGVSLTMGWNGVLAISRGGTGLGSLGTANQLLRVNTGETALEYFTPTWTTNTGTVTSVAASVGGTALGVSGTPITSSGTLAFAWAGTSGQYVDGQGNLQNFPAIPAGTVTSVALALPSNTFDISGSPVTSLGTLTGAFKSQIKKTVLAAPWGADGTPIWRQLQTSDLQQNGATTGQVITWNGTEWAAANPPGGVTSVAAGNGMNFTTITATGSVVLGTPSSITLSSTNSVTSTSHTHAFVPGGTSSQYIRGDGSLNTFPTIPVVQWSDSLVAYGRTSVGGLTYSTGLKYDYTNSAFSVGTRAAGSVGTGSVQLGGNSVISGDYAIGLGYQNTVSGNYSTASGYNHTVLANYCFVSGNANTQTNSSGVGSFLSGSGISHGTGTYLFASGYLLTVSGHYSFTVGTENTNSGTYSAIIGRNGTVTHSGNVMLLDSGSGTNITSGTSNQFTARFYNGYRFMTTNTVRAMDISSSRVITIDNLAGSGTRMVVANSSGELSTQTIPSGANSVWYIQGTATDATTNAQDIVRTGKVRIGASGTSTYMLSVVGNAYIMNGVEINNNQSYKGFNTSATAVNLIKINSSNYIEIGQSSYDIYLANYTSGRSADTVTTSDKYLYVNSSGYLKAESAQWVRNDGASAYITSSESHAADSTDRKVTFDVANFANNGYYGLGGSSGDYRINFPSGDTYHFVVVTLEYTTSGTPTVTATLRRVSTTIETNVSTSADGRKVMTIHTMMGGSGTSDYPTVYLSVSGSAITLQKCRMTVIPMGAVPP